jgi:hypothetical protein
MRDRVVGVGLGRDELVDQIRVDRESRGALGLEGPELRVAGGDAVLDEL